MNTSKSGMIYLNCQEDLIKIMVEDMNRLVLYLYETYITNNIFGIHLKIAGYEYDK